MKIVPLASALLCIFFVPLAARAGIEVRNGGYAVECLSPDTNTAKFYMLDLAENPKSSEAIPNKFTDYQVEANLSPEAIVLKKLKYIGQYNKGFENKLSNYLEDLLLHHEFVKGLDFEASDLGSWSFSLQKCRNLARVATTLFIEDVPHLYIDKSLWEKFDTANRVALWLHEITYAWLSQEFDIHTSTATRCLVSRFMNASLPTDEFYKNFKDEVKTAVQSDSCR